MTPFPLLAVLLLLCLRAPRAAAGPLDPTPTPWPHQFHAKLLMDYRGNLSIADLWYDWPGGRNLHVIRYQLAADAPYYDAEWNNGTSFFYTPARRTCRSAAVGVGILRPDWLAPGAAYLGRAPADGFDCHVWAKADFITYYEDVQTRRPVKWIFYTVRKKMADAPRSTRIYPSPFVSHQIPSPFAASLPPCGNTGNRRRPETNKTASRPWRCRLRPAIGSPPGSPRRLVVLFHLRSRWDPLQETPTC